MAIIRFLILSLALLASTFGADTDLVGLIQIDSSGVPRAVNPITGSANVGKSLIFGSDGKIGPVDVLTQSEWTTQRSTLDTQLAAKAATSHTHTLSQLSDITATGTSLASAANASAARTVLGLGALATASGVTASQITDSTTIGRSILTGVDAAAIISALGLGSLATAAATAQSAAEAAQDAAELADWYGTEASVMSMRPAMWFSPESIVITTAQAIAPTILQWSDRGGRGNHATQGTSANRPTWTADAINGQPGVTFSAGKDFAIPPVKWREAFIVARPNAAGNATMIASDGTDWFQLLNASGVIGESYTGTTLTVPPGLRRTWTAQAHLWTWQMSPVPYVTGTTNAWVYGRGIDGHSILTKATGTGTFAPTILGGHGGTSYDLNGVVCEVIVYDEPLTQAGRDSVMEYLRRKYGLTMSGGTYMVAHGDSITQGANVVAGQRWMDYLIGYGGGAGLTDNTWEGTIAAVGGNNIADCQADTVWIDFASRHRKNLAFLFAGTNDGNNGATAAAAAARYAAWCAQWKEAGWRVVACYMLPRGLSMEAFRTAFNAEVADFVADGVADAVYPGSDATLWAAGANANATYFSDQVHPTALGNSRFAAAIQSTVEATSAMAQIIPPGRAAKRGGSVDLTGTNGQLLIGNGSGFSKATLTAGSGVTITNGSGTITIAATGGGLGGGTGSVDNAVTRADGTGAATLQGSDISISDSTTSTANQVGFVNIHSGQTNSSLYLAPKGTGAFWLGPAATGSSTTGNARGANAFDAQTLRNAATQVASGGYSFLGGSYSTASGTHAIAIGYGVSSSGFASVAVGGGNTASGDYSLVAGSSSSATATGSTAVGMQSSATHVGEFAVAGGRRSAAGDAETSVVTAFGTTTNNTATEIYLNGVNSRLTIPSGHCYACDIRWVAKSGANVAGGKRFCIINNNAGTTALDGAVDTIGTDHNTPGWGGITITAVDSTTDYLKIEVTGATSTTINWVVTINFTVNG